MINLRDLSFIVKVIFYPIIFLLPILQTLVLRDFRDFNDAYNYLAGYNYIYFNGFDIGGNPFFGKGTEFLLDFFYHVLTPFVGYANIADLLLINAILFSFFYIVLVEYVAWACFRSQLISRKTRHILCLVLYAVVPLGISNQLARQSIFLFVPIIAYFLLRGRISSLFLPALISLASHSGSILVHFPFIYLLTKGKRAFSPFIKLLTFVVLILFVNLALGNIAFDLTYNPVLKIRTDYWSRISSNLILVFIIVTLFLNLGKLNLHMLLLAFLSLCLMYFSQPIIYRVFYGIEFFLVPLLYIIVLERYNALSIFVTLLMSAFLIFLKLFLILEKTL